MAETPKTKDLLYEIDRLKKQVEELRSEGDRYGLRWHPIPEEFESDSENALPVLKEKGGKFGDVELDPSADHNVLIEGDNYHALSVLSYTHKGKINVIYIDPPYNTGSDGFRYHDKRIAKEFPNGVEVPADHPYRYTYWLSFMEKRLRLASELLKQGGVVFISIDDNEQANLKILSDKIFGERNFVACITVHSNPRGRQSSAHVAPTHEYLLVYLKGEDAQIMGEKLTSERKKEYKYEDQLGHYREIGLRLRGGRATAAESPTLHFPLYINPKSRDILLEKSKGLVEVIPKFENGTLGTWRWSKKKILSDMGYLLARPVRTKTGERWDIFQKDYLTEDKTLKVKSVWLDKEINYDNAADEIKSIFGNKVFNYAKPIALIKKIVGIAGDSNSVILDFFAGSGTTGHKVLELNKEDGGNRRFILCTNNEGDICEKITYERLKRVMKGYTTPSKEKVAGLGGNLKYLKTAFVPKHVEYGLTDEARLDLTRRANLLLALKENTFTPVESADRYEVFSSPNRITGIYFTEDKVQLDEMLKSLKTKAKGKTVVVYIFSWEKGSYKAGFEDYPDFHFEDIPEPILDVYRSIGY